MIKRWYENEILKKKSHDLSYVLEEVPRKHQVCEGHLKPIDGWPVDPGTIKDAQGLKYDPSSR